MARARAAVRLVRVGGDVVMPGQTTLAPCAWCGAGSERTVEVAPAQYDKGGRLKAPAVVVPACGVHPSEVVAAPKRRGRRKPGEEQLQLEVPE